MPLLRSLRWKVAMIYQCCEGFFTISHQAWIKGERCDAASVHSILTEVISHAELSLCMNACHGNDTPLRRIYMHASFAMAAIYNAASERKEITSTHLSRETSSKNASCINQNALFSQCMCFQRVKLCALSGKWHLTGEQARGVWNADLFSLCSGARTIIDAAVAFVISRSVCVKM